jgi:hypothetical protein
MILDRLLLMIQWSRCTTGIHASAVWAIDTADLLLDTADHLPCAGTRQTGHGSDSDDRGCLPCAHDSRTRQSVCRVFYGVHGRIK